MLIKKLSKQIRVVNEDKNASSPFLKFYVTYSITLNLQLSLVLDAISHLIFGYPVIVLEFGTSHSLLINYYYIFLFYEIVIMNRILVLILAYHITKKCFAVVELLE